VSVSQQGSAVAVGWWLVVGRVLNPSTNAGYFIFGGLPGMVGYFY